MTRGERFVAFDLGELQQLLAAVVTAEPLHTVAAGPGNLLPALGAEISDALNATIARQTEAAPARKQAGNEIEGLLDDVRERIEHTRWLRDEHGWPEPRTIYDLWADPRVTLHNRIGGRPEDENLELAAALILLVALDRREALARKGA